MEEDRPGPRLRQSLDSTAVFIGYPCGKALQHGQLLNPAKSPCEQCGQPARSGVVSDAYFCLYFDVYESYPRAR